MLMNNIIYRFAESEGDHAKRLEASFRTTRLKRKALMTLLIGREYPGQPEWAKAMTQEQLMHRLSVTIQPDGLIVPTADMRILAEKVEDGAGTLVSTHHEVGAREKSNDRIKAGHRIGTVPYPYQTGPDGTYLTDEWHHAIAGIFELLIADGSYAVVADQLNDLRLATATGEAWNKDNARSFCQLTEHCGYAKKPVTTGEKHGPFHLYIPFALPTLKPPVSLNDWLTANSNLLPKFKGVLAP